MNKTRFILYHFALLTFAIGVFNCNGQTKVKEITHLNQIHLSKSGVYNYWLEMGTNTYGQPILVPVIVVQGNLPGPTLGLTAAIHGNELNGIPIIHQIVESIDTTVLKGRIIAIPGLNAISLQNHKRRFIDEEDLNRNFPGKENGNRSQQYSYKIKERVLPEFNFLIDMHTASFGRLNTMYVRADTSNDTMRKMAELQGADIIVHGKGMPSFGSISKSNRTLRAEAQLLGIPSITVEYGNPQVFQKDIIYRGVKGIFNTLKWLKMYDGAIEKSSNITTFCEKSYWIYMDEGGFLDVVVELNQMVDKGDKIAEVRNAFGALTKEYFAPEDGIIIGKSSNPTNMSGGRIVHLGIMTE
nr:succinylglutamate desuccinylase/aspartoacylase family protein [Allomuricauda sp.]